MISAPVISNKYQVFLQHCIIDSPSSNRATHPYTHMACLTAQVSNPLIGQCRTHFAVPESCLVSPVCRPPSLSVFFFLTSSLLQPHSLFSLLFSLSISLLSIYPNLTPSISLSSSHPPFLFSSSNPLLFHLSTNSVSTGPNRNLTSFVNFSAAGPDSRRRILTPASFDSRSSPPAKKKIKAFLTI